MAKAFAIILVITLFVLVLAFRGIFGEFPDEWQWAGIILAGLALTMAMPSILQMFWGRPRVETEFDVSTERGKRSLVMFIKNPPIASRVLRTLGVRREAVQGLTAELRVSECGSGRIVVPIRHLALYSGDETHRMIQLPPTYSVGAAVMVAMWSNITKGAVIPGDKLRGPLELGQGYYTAQVILFVDGDPAKFTRQFVVGKDADDLIWSKVPQSTSRKGGSQT